MGIDKRGPCLQDTHPCYLSVRKGIFHNGAWKGICYSGYCVYHYFYFKLTLRKDISQERRWNLMFPLFQNKKFKTSVIVYAAVIPVLLLMLFPFAVMISSSLKTQGATVTFPPTWIPKPLMLRNYIDIFKAIPLARLFANTFIVAGGATILVLVCAVPAAYALIRFNLHGKSFDLK